MLAKQFDSDGIKISITSISKWFTLMVADLSELLFAGSYSVIISQTSLEVTIFITR